MDDVISSIEKVMRVFKGQKQNYKKRSRSFSMQNQRVDLSKGKSIKLQDIAKQDFIINLEPVKTSIVRKSKNFLPGVERKKLRKKGTADPSLDMCKYFYFSINVHQ